jgi:integral membrane protein
VLLLVYALFTLAAGARAAVQIATQWHVAPVAYSLSVVAAATYALGYVAISRAAQGRTAFARRMLWVELAGVLAVGTLSLVRRDWFADASVWSDYGIGYGFVPAVLPVTGLWWLRWQDAGANQAPGTMERMSARVVTAFRVIAFAEAVSWLGLLIGMYFKYVPESGEGGVKVFGPIHGTIFIVYVLLSLVLARLLRWSVGTTILALASSILPFCTVWFEVWAHRSGRLDVRTSGAPEGRTAFTSAP